MKQPISQRSKKNWDKKASSYMAIQMSYSEPKPKTHGGKRKGSGRPKIKDKKITVIFYFRKSELEIFGGKKAFMEYVKKQVTGE